MSYDTSHAVLYRLPTKNYRMNYNLEIRHKKGSENVLADALSRV